MVPPTLLDTDTLSFYLQGHPAVTAQAAAYVAAHHQLVFSLVTYYEVLRGLRCRDARRQLAGFEALTADSRVLPLTQESVALSAAWYAEQRRRGTPLDHFDLLIAGVAVADGLVLATHNVRHFGRLAGLTVVDWAGA